MTERLEVGRVGRAHGLSGEVVVTFSSDRPERWLRGSMLYADDRPLVVDAARPHHGRWLVRFRDVDDRDGAEALRGALLTGEPLGPLPDGEYWAHELVGAEMRDADGRSLGTIVAVEANPASDLLVLDAGALVPVAFMVSAGDGVVIVDPPDGLLEE